MSVAVCRETIKIRPSIKAVIIYMYRHTLILTPSVVGAHGLGLKTQKSINNGHHQALHIIIAVSKEPAGKRTGEGVNYSLTVAVRLRGAAISSSLSLD